MTAHVGDILTHGSQGENDAGIVRGFRAVELLCVVDILLNVVNHVVIVGIGHVPAASGKANDDPIAANGADRGCVLCGQSLQVAAGGLIDGFHVSVGQLQERKNFSCRCQHVVVGDQGLLGVGQGVVSCPGGVDGRFGFRRDGADGVDQPNDRIGCKLILCRLGHSQGENVVAVILIVESAVAACNDAASTELLIACRVVQGGLDRLRAVGLCLDHIDAAGIGIIGDIEIDIAACLIGGGKQNGTLGIGRFLHGPENLHGVRVHGNDVFAAAPAAYTDVNDAAIDDRCAGGSAAVGRAVLHGQIGQNARFCIQCGAAEAGVVQGEVDLAVLIAHGGADGTVTNGQVRNERAGILVTAADVAAVAAADHIITDDHRACPVVALFVGLPPNQ